MFSVNASKVKRKAASNINYVKLHKAGFPTVALTRRKSKLNKMSKQKKLKANSTSASPILKGYEHG